MPTLEATPPVPTLDQPRTQPSLLDRLKHAVLSKQSEEPVPSHWPTQTPAWDNVGLSVENSVETFVASMRGVPAIEWIVARSQGPHVHYLVGVSGSWPETIDRIEERLFPIAKTAHMTFDYDVLDASDEDHPGYLAVYPA